MKVYLAARWGCNEAVQVNATMLSILGVVVVSTWHSMSVDMDTDDAFFGFYALRDLQGIDECDMLVLFAERRGFAGMNTGGRHVEMGYALARGKRIVIIGERENVFHYLLGPVSVFPSFHDFVDELLYGDSFPFRRKT